MFETLVIFTEDDVLELIHAKNSELLRKLKDLPVWDTIEEDLSDNNISLNSIQDLQDLIQALSSIAPEDRSIRLKLFLDQRYGKPLRKNP
jgi:hypothetical protein